MASISRFFPTAARVLLGLVFTVFGLNFFLQFLPQPPMAAEAGAFAGALVAGKYLLVVKIVEVAAGVALLANVFVPLALALLAPPIIGILLFHGVYAPDGMILPIVILLLEGYLVWAYRSAFAPMLQARTSVT